MDSNICAKCMAHAGNDAVLLKNGTYLCPACYQRMYPAQKLSSKPQRFYISVEGVVAVVVVIGVFVLGYYIFQHVVAQQKEEALAAKHAEELAEQRHKEELAEQEAVRVRIENERKEALGREQKEKERREQAAKAAELERDNKRLADLAAKEKKRREDEWKVADLRERERLADLARKARDAADLTKTRSGEIASLVKTINDTQKALAAATVGKPDLVRRAAGFKQIVRIAEEIKAGILKQYREDQKISAAVAIDDLAKWRTEATTKTKSVGPGSGITVEVESDHPKLVAKFDKASEDSRQASEKLQALTDEIEKMDAAEADLKPKIVVATSRLTEMNATNAELAAAGGLAKAPAGMPGVANKTILLKNGTQLKAQSIITAGEEVMYKDESGKMQTIKLADVDKIQQ